ncbi:MAG: hypothetical protein AAF636_27970 [Pseudomonadota bacterium]
MPAGVKAFFDNGGGSAIIARVIGKNSKTASLCVKGMLIKSKGPGHSRNRIFGKVSLGTVATDAAVSRLPMPRGFRLQLAYWARAANPVPSANPFAETGDINSPPPAHVEVFENMSLNQQSQNYWKTQLAKIRSVLVEVEINEKVF